MALFKVSPRFGAFQAQAVGHTEHYVFFSFSMNLTFSVWKVSQFSSKKLGRILENPSLDEKAGGSISINITYGSVARHIFRFTMGELAFFNKWWTNQTKSVRQDVKKLVHEGQLEFAGIVL